MSAPLKMMRPLSVASTPAIWPISVVLPAPFGPISACTSPRVTSKVTSSVATTPPKRLLTPRSSSMAAPSEEAGNTLGRQHDDRQQHDAHREAGMVLVVRRELREPDDAVVGDQMLEAEEHRGADDAAPEGADAAQDHHDHQRAGLDPVKQARADIARLVGDQRARQAADAAGDDEAEELVAIDRKADRFGARFVLANRRDHAAEARVHQAMHGVEHRGQDAE